MTINPRRVGLYLSILGVIIGVFANLPHDQIVAMFGQTGGGIVAAWTPALMMMLLGINGVLHMIPAPNTPEATAKFMLGPSAPAVPPVVKAVIIFAVLAISALALTVPAQAQPKARPTFTGDVGADIKAAAARAATGTTAASSSSAETCDLNLFAKGGDLVSVIAQIQQCVAADAAKGAGVLLPDWLGAQASATAKQDTTALNCINPAVEIIKAAIGTPAVAAVPAVVADPTATPPIAAKPAVVAVPAVLPGPVTLFQKLREFLNAGGKAACKEAINTTVQMLLVP